MSDHEFRAVLAALDAGAPPVAAPVPPLRSVAVLGAGAVGRLLACEALAAGLEVRLHSVLGRELTELAEAGTITVRGAHLVGSYPVSTEPSDRPHIRLSRSLDEAVAGVDAIVVATPATAHATYAGLLAGNLADGQLLVLVPGRFLGSVALSRDLQAHLCSARVTVAELEAVPYLATARGAGVEVHGVARHLGVSALPVTDADQVAARLRPLVPALRPVDGPLDTAFGTVTGVLAVAPVLTNVAVVNGGTGTGVLLKELVPQALADSLLHQLDEERREVAFRYGVRDLPSAAGWLRRAYGGQPADEVEDDGDLAAALRDLEVFDELRIGTGGGPRVIDDVPHSLVPLASAGREAGVPTPATDTMVALASSFAGTDFGREGRSLQTLGLAGHDPGELRRVIAAPRADRPHTDVWRRL
ncbi:NAD/NADP octopine/nopaline dehydrogenase family protein [Nocardioides sp. TF02-7]|uniref:NAD/NADP octopine/nopaline dehydrogenase family protein n=1 Tax=Nocardioides sp. TF02-7 TaxID=2917724 RepID=UPI001F053A81|nr:NAD/NADP octopine/nopaline dehydrogenase family protein [Nocardioides sp. TF02-7]UMG94098.1 NAD/NADP octopine/nopaline dehydrogenase family protein [Nocardioides sp. TF02-7]